MVAATDEYERESNWLERFVQECLNFDSAFWTPSARLNDTFETWCKENGCEPNKRGLWHRLRQEQCEQKTTRQGRGWMGVSIAPDGEDQSNGQVTA